MGAILAQPSIGGGDEDIGKHPIRSQLYDRRATAVARAARPKILRREAGARGR